MSNFDIEQPLTEEEQEQRDEELFARFRAMSADRILECISGLVQARLVRVIVFANPDEPNGDNPDFDDIPAQARDVCDMLGTLDGSKPIDGDRAWPDAAGNFDDGVDDTENQDEWLNDR